MRLVLLALSVLAALTMTGAAAQGDVTHTVLNFDELEGWADDDHDAALDVFRSTCRDMRAPDWVPICALAETQTNARTFFELFFRPVLIEDGAPALFTGYFEPELNGSRSRSGRFRLSALPPAARGKGWPMVFPRGYRRSGALVGAGPGDRLGR